MKLRIIIFLCFALGLFAEDSLDLLKVNSQKQVRNFISLLNEQSLTYNQLDAIKDIQNDIFERVIELEFINNDIYIFSKKAKDKNTTVYDEQLSYLKNQKNKLINDFPVKLIQGKDFDFQIASLVFSKEIALLNNKLKDKNLSTFEELSAVNELSILKVSQNFFQDLYILKKSYLQGIDKSAIDKFLKVALSKLQISPFQVSDKLSFKEKSMEEEQNLKFSILLETYEDIFLNLSKNSSFFGSNFIIKNFKINRLINYINAKTGLKNDYIDFGKIFAMFLVALFIFLIRKLIYKAIYLIFVHSFLNIEGDGATEYRALKMIENPIGLFLILINIELWIALFYHPAPTPAKIAIFIQILYTLIATYFIIELVEIYGSLLLLKFTNASARKGIISVILRIVKVLLLLIAAIAILQEIGFDPTALITSLGIGGIALAIGAKDMIANFFASLTLVFNNSISQGDWVIINSVEGVIVEIGIKNTIIRGFDNSLNFIPNASITSTNIKNFSKRKVGSKINFEIEIFYENQPELLQKCLREIKIMLENHPEIANPRQELPQLSAKIKESNPDISVSDLLGYRSNIFVNLHKFNDSLMSILVYCFAKSVRWDQQFQIQENILLEVIKILENNKVRFGMPNKLLYLATAEKMHNAEEK